MSLILVAEPEGRHVERIRNALGGEGFELRIVGEVEEALIVARAQPPRLALVSSEIPQSRRLFETFARRTGGPGAVALIPERQAYEVTSQSLGADEIVAKPFTDQDLRMAVRRVLSGATDAVPEIFADDEDEEGSAAPAASASTQQLTSEDIFGDLVAEFESDMQPEGPAPAKEGEEEEAAPKPPAAASPTSEEPPAKPRKQPAGKGLDHTLEQTLAGLRDLSAGPPKKKKKTRRRPLDDSDVDALLSETLSGLDLPRRRRPGRPTPPAESETSPPETGPTAPADAASADESRAEPTPPASREPVTSQEPPEPRETPEPVREPAPGDGEPAATDPRRFGQYELLDRIAVGGMAEVWKARMTGVEGFRKTVAIKRILSHLTGDEDFVRMFVDEAKLAAQLNHPNIIHIYDLGKIRDHYYIAMEYVEGMNLRGLLNVSRKKGMPMPRGLALLIAARLASALSHAHQKKDEGGRELGLVHRDVSPQNVLLSYEGDIKLCDFGIVKAVTKTSQTQMGALKGKLQYMSPEQAWGKPVDARSDIFSLGALLFEMLTGRRLFGGDNEISVLEAVRQCRFTAPRRLDPTIPEPVEDIVLKALEHDPDKRFETAGGFQQEIEELMYSLRPTPGPGDLAGYMRDVRDAPELEEPEAEPPAASSAELLETPPKPEAPEESSETGPLEAAQDLPALGLAQDEDVPEPEPPEPAEPKQETPSPVEAETGTGPEEEEEIATTPPAEPAATVKLETVKAPPGEAAAEETAEPVAPAETWEAEPEDSYSGPDKKLWIGLGLLLLVLAALAAYYFLVLRTPSEPARLPPSAVTAPESEPETGGDMETQAPDGSGEAHDAPDGEEPAAGAAAGPEGEASQAPEDVDLDALVAEELAKREDELRRQFEARERELARQIEETRSRAAESDETPPPTSDAEGSGGGEDQNGAGDTNLPLVSALEAKYPRTFGRARTAEP